MSAKEKIKQFIHFYFTGIFLCFCFLFLFTYLLPELLLQSNKSSVDRLHWTEHLKALKDYKESKIDSASYQKVYNNLSEKQKKVAEKLIE